MRQVQNSCAACLESSTSDFKVEKKCTRKAVVSFFECNIPWCPLTLRASVQLKSRFWNIFWVIPLDSNTGLLSWVNICWDSAEGWTWLCRNSMHGSLTDDQSSCARLKMMLIKSSWLFCKRLQQSRKSLMTPVNTPSPLLLIIKFNVFCIPGRGERIKMKQVRLQNCCTILAIHIVAINSSWDLYKYIPLSSVC